MCVRACLTILKHAESVVQSLNIKCTEYAIANEQALLSCQGAAFKNYKKNLN